MQVQVAKIMYIHLLYDIDYSDTGYITIKYNVYEITYCGYFV